MQLKLPELISLNDYINKERTNRYVAAKIKGDLTLQVVWACKAQGIKPIKNLKKIKIIWREKNQRRDPDNVAFGTKFILDGLKEAGIIPTDGWKLWRGRPDIRHQFEISKDVGCTVILK